MNRVQLIREIARRLGIHKTLVGEVLMLCFERITQLVLEGQKVVIQKFGVFELRKSSARLGYNPSNGRRFFIPKSSRFAFRPFVCLLESFEGKRALGSLKA